jgi:hypothetical protein
MLSGRRCEFPDTYFELVHCGDFIACAAFKIQIMLLQSNPLCSAGGTPRASVSEQPAAIGIMFDIEEVAELGMALVVKQVAPLLHPEIRTCFLMNDAQLVKGGSAQMDGAIAAGDIVTRIDSTEFTSSVCENSSSALASVKDVTSGVCGSTLVLHAFRPSDGHTFEATLTRGNAQSVAFPACFTIVCDSLHFVAVTFL